MRDINIRCFLLLCFFNVFILAIREIGTSQHLRIVRGEESESRARLGESLCQRDLEWFFTRLILIEERITEAEIDDTQRYFLGVVQASIKAKIDGARR